MEIAIAGAHGQVARHLTRLLAARGDRVRGLVRNPGHVEDVRADGAEAVVCDLETATAGEVAEAVRGCDAVVFAAGAGPGSGADRKGTMDRDGAVLLLDGAAAAGVRRYVMVSAVGAEAPPAGDEVFAVYLRAKADADAALMASSLRWTVVRPGRLTDDEAAGTADVRTDASRGEVARADVAAVLAEVLHEPRTGGTVLYVNGGDVPVAEAVAAAVT